MLTTAIIVEQQVLNLITLITTPAEAINLLRLDANKSHCSFDQQECKSNLHNDMGIGTIAHLL